MKGITGACADMPDYSAEKGETPAQAKAIALRGYVLNKMAGYKKNIVRRMRRPCRQCNKMFVPETKWVRLCVKCFEKARGRGLHKTKIGDWIFVRTCLQCKKEYGSDFKNEINFVCPKCCSLKFRNRYARLRREKC